jgi:pimeloyl-ACP methyl ester carboxylesterase
VLIGSIDNVDSHRLVDYLIAGVPEAQKIVFEGAGHLPNIEQPDESNRVVLDFLSQVKKSP